MNRYFFRLPRSGEYYHTPSILVVTPPLEYYWERRGDRPTNTNGQYTGTLSQSDEQALIQSGNYLELRPDSDRDFILNRLTPAGITAYDWRRALAPYAVESTPLPKRPDPRLKTNHKLGAPKGKLP